MPGGFDLTVVLSQTSAVEKIQQLQNPNPDTRQQQFASQLQEERVRLRSNVQDTKETEQTKIHGDQKRQQRHKGNQDQSHKEEKEGSSSPHHHLGIDEGQLIDIKV